MTPYMAQGAAQAMEDALTLRQIFRRNGYRDFETVWSEFERERQPRTAKIQMISHVNTWMSGKTDGTWLYGHNAAELALGSHTA